MPDLPQGCEPLKRLYKFVYGNGDEERALIATLARMQSDIQFLKWAVMGGIGLGFTAMVSLGGAILWLVWDHVSAGRIAAAIVAFLGSLANGYS